MTVYTALLRKECYTQRSGILGLLLLLPCVPALAFILGKPEILDVDLLPIMGAMVGCVSASFVIGTRLIPDEREGNGYRFLERLPGNLHRAYLAKLTCYVLVIVGCAIYGNLVAQLTLELRGKVLPSEIRFSEIASSAALLIPLCCALWIFAASAWAPSGALAFPTGLICASVLCWPAHYLFVRSDWFVARAWEPWAFYSLSGSAAVLSAWASFAIGLRHSSSRSRAALVGLTVAALLVSPLWAWTAYRWHRVVHLDPSDPEFAILSVQVDENSSMAFVQATREGFGLDDKGRDWPSNPASIHGFRVDLESGAWESCPVDTMALDRNSDSRNLGVAAASLPPGATLSQSRYGFGRAVRDESSRRIGMYDESRARFYAFADVLSEVEERYWFVFLFNMRVLPDHWLVRNEWEFSSRGTSDVWTRIDPGTGERSSVKYLNDDDRIVAIFEDGNLLVARAGGMLRLDVTSGDTQSVELEEWRENALSVMFHTQRTPISVDSLSLFAHYENIATFDPSKNEFRWLPGGNYRLLKQTDSESAVFLDEHKRLVRMDLRTGELTALFPKDS